MVLMAAEPKRLLPIRPSTTLFCPLILPVGQLDSVCLFMFQPSLSLCEC